jgi:hypothetical protein
LKDKVKTSRKGRGDIRNTHKETPEYAPSYSGEKNKPSQENRSDRLIDRIILEWLKLIILFIERLSTTSPGISKGEN